LPVRSAHSKRSFIHELLVGSLGYLVAVRVEQGNICYCMHLVSVRGMAWHGTVLGRLQGPLRRLVYSITLKRNAPHGLGMPPRCPATTDLLAKRARAG
jgi:hypothetical protein